MDDYYLYSHNVSSAPPPPGADYVASVLALTPAAFWTMQEASGNLADSSGNGWTATASGTPTYSVSGPTINGEAFNAITFVRSGSTKFIPSTTLTDPGTGGFTIMAWVKIPTDSTVHGLLGKFQTNEGTFYFRRDASNRLQVITVNDANATHGNAAEAIFPNDTWCWVAGRYDTSGTPTLRAYVDAETTDTTSFTGTWDRVGDPIVEIGEFGSDYLDGEMCLMAYWASPLSDGQMDSLRTGVF